MICNQSDSLMDLIYWSNDRISTYLRWMLSQSPGAPKIFLRINLHRTKCLIILKRVVSSATVIEFAYASPTHNDFSKNFLVTTLRFGFWIIGSRSLRITVVDYAPIIAGFRKKKMNKESVANKLTDQCKHVIQMIMYESSEAFNCIILMYSLFQDCMERIIGGTRLTCSNIDSNSLGGFWGNWISSFILLGDPETIWYTRY